jgi:triosephosphate isomerase
MYGERALKLAKAADEYSARYDVSVIFTAQYTDIARIRQATRHIRVYAQHMDGIYPGRGIGAVLPEAIREAGAHGVMLNHAEKPLNCDTLQKTIQRAKETGLETIVCAATPEEGLGIAKMGPDILLVESPLLIGAGKRTPEQIAEVRRINQLIHAQFPGMKILHGAGISDEKDVYDIIKAGAEATGSTSGIMRAAEPEAMLKKMLCAVHTAWMDADQERRGV